MIAPPPEAAALVHTFYTIDTAAGRIEEAIPAYSAQLIVMVRGTVHFTFDDGSTGISASVFINAPQMRSARAVLEVRSRDVPFMLEDGQIVGRLVYERMSAPPERLYGSGIASNYQGQGLKLAKQFR